MHGLAGQLPHLEHTFLKRYSCFTRLHKRWYHEPAGTCMGATVASPNVTYALKRVLTVDSTCLQVHCRGSEAGAAASCSESYSARLWYLVHNRKQFADFGQPYHSRSLASKGLTSSRALKRRFAVHTCPKAPSAVPLRQLAVPQRTAQAGRQASWLARNATCSPLGSCVTGSQTRSIDTGDGW
jgi:hypothetical protein